MAYMTSGLSVRKPYVTLLCGKYSRCGAGGGNGIGKNIERDTAMRLSEKVNKRLSGIGQQAEERASRLVKQMAE